MGNQRDNLRTHELSAMVVYGITVKEAMGDTTAMLNRDSIRVGPIVGCYACEMSLNEARKKPCPGEPPGKLAYVQEGV